MQNELYTIQFYHHLMTDLQAVPEQWSWTPQIFANFTKFLKKAELPEEFELLDKRGFELLENEKPRAPCPRPTPIRKPSMMSTVWSISTGQLGLSAWLCSLPMPAHLLTRWTWETGKSPWFHSSNWKHQCYQHSSAKPKTQQLPGRKI